MEVRVDVKGSCYEYSVALWTGAEYHERRLSLASCTDLELVLIVTLLLFERLDQEVVGSK